MTQRPWKPRSRFRRVLRRSALVWWAAALTLGMITASITSSNLGRARRAADAWGGAQRVWVVQRAVAAGDAVHLGDVTLASRPRGVVPAGALGAAVSPVGRSARVRLVPGEVVVRDRVVAAGGVAAMVEGGRRAIAMKNDESMPALRPGDRVDMLATFDVGDSPDPSTSSAAPSFPVATNAAVLAVSARTVTLSVTSKEAPRVAFALARAAVTVSVRGG